MSTNFYPSKLLLFGEYTVLHQGMALAIPFPDYNGEWSRDTSDPSQDEIFSSFIEYLSRINSLSLNIEGLTTDYNQGLRFKSNIPIGYGIGSSGAFTAAIYDRYVINPATDLLALKNQLASIESFFHGESSGIDPLVSYTKQVILKTASGLLETRSPINHAVLDKLELIDSMQPRSSATYIKIYKEKLVQASFKEQMEKLTHYQNQAINILTDVSMDGDLMSTIHSISQIQLEHLDEMIPDPIKKDWVVGLKEKTHCYKLCGAGGGGFFIKFKT